MVTRVLNDATVMVSWEKNFSGENDNFLLFNKFSNVINFPKEINNNLSEVNDKSGIVGYLRDLLRDRMSVNNCFPLSFWVYLITTLLLLTFRFLVHENVT